MKVFLKSAAVWLATLCALMLLLFLSSMIPQSAIATNLSDSALELMKLEPQNAINKKAFHSLQDNYADVILLGVTAGVDSTEPVRSSINTRYYDGEESGEAYGLFAAAAGVKPNTDYTRYWHGSMIILRPLLTVLDIKGIRLFGGIALILLTGALCLALYRKKCAAAAVILVVSLMAVQSWYVPFSVEYTISYAIMLAAGLLFVKNEADNGALVILSAAVGTVTAFADFLTTETITVFVPLLLVFFLRMKSGKAEKLKENLILSIKCAAVWLVAYALTFASKWLLASAVTGENAFKAALSAAETRTVGETGESDIFTQIIMSIGANLSALFVTDKRISAAAIIIGLAIYAVVLVVLAKAVRFKPDKDKLVLFLSIGAIPLARYALLSNHSYLHSFFTYRALMITAMSLLGMIWFSTGVVKKKKRKK